MIGGPVCFVCTNEIVGNGKLSKVKGYICANCGQSVSKGARTEGERCELILFADAQTLPELPFQV